MKTNKFIAGILTLTITSQAFAWDLGFAKGDDPQIVKDATEGVKHVATEAEKGVRKGGTELANGVRDVFAVVGNATGISDIIESNMETIVNAGRAQACLATLCYSEVLRKKQLDEAEEEAKKQTELAIKTYTEMGVTEKRKALIAAAKKAYDLAKSRYAMLYEKYQLVVNEHKAFYSIQQAIFAEVSYRKKLEAAGVQGRPLQNREMIAPTQEFASNRVTVGYTVAMQKLDEQIKTISAQTGRSREKLLAEFVRVVEFSTLKGIVDDTNAIGANILKEEADLKIQLKEAYLQMKKCENDYNMEMS